MLITHDEIIRSRQNEIFNEVQDIDQEILNLQNRIELLQAKRKLRVAEHQMLQTVEDRGLIASDSQRVTRIKIEDAIKRIFEQAGRPMSISEIMERLEDFGYQWSNYHTGYQRLRGIRVLQQTGARGYYQVIR